MKETGRKACSLDELAAMVHVLPECGVYSSGYGHALDFLSFGMLDDDCNVYMDDDGLLSYQFKTAEELEREHKTADDLLAIWNSTFDELEGFDCPHFILDSDECDLQAMAVLLYNEHCDDDGYGFLAALTRDDLAKLDVIYDLGIDLKVESYVAGVPFEDIMA